MLLNIARDSLFVNAINNKNEVIMKVNESLVILENNGYVCEHYNDDTVKVPIYIDKLLDYHGNPLKKSFDLTCRLGVTKEEVAKIEEILPGFVKDFDEQYDSTGGDGNSIEVEVRYTGEEPSWDGRDFGTYDPGWGETEVIEKQDSIQAKVTEAIREMIPYMAEDFDEAEETLKPKLEAILKIIVNRSGTDAI